jgi:GT2 family glycosyltransferase
LLRHTRSPYELILVDNGSTDGTPEYLQEIRGRQGPTRVEIIRNETNVGFPAGCNQALAKATGRYLVLLNNDTVLTPGWLEGLVACSLQDWPGVGLVGPVTNAAPDAQGIRVPYTRLEDLDGFAAQRRTAFAGKTQVVFRLTGFCLLIRREVLDRIGILDERFGIGFFEDDDLCVRAREAGFRLLVAQDVYIHHFGNRTFQHLGLDTRRHLEASFALFREKWGPEYTSGYQLPPQPAAPSTDQPAAAQGATASVPVPVQAVEPVGRCS